MTSWKLTDACKLAEQHKYTFFKSSAQSIARVTPGEAVKLIFAFESDAPEAPGAERMWVVVDAISNVGVFSGRLNNQPQHITDLKHGDVIEFEARHIINTAHDDADNLVERYIQRCFVTRKVLDDGLPVGCLYREEPDDEHDSGWRITSDTETQEYMDDADNVAYVSLGAVLSQDDSIIHLLDEPAGSVFVRDAETGAFVRDDGDSDSDTEQG